MPAQTACCRISSRISRSSSGAVLSRFAMMSFGIAHSNRSDLTVELTSSELTSATVHPRKAYMPNFTAFVILLAVILYFWTGFRVGQARIKFKIKAPATTGNPDFERVFRIQMNMLEWMPVFLPAVYLSAIYVSDIGAALLGIVWIAG